MASGEKPPSDEPGREASVLLVDDAEAVRSVTRMLLEEAGFAVLTANSGHEALEAFREHQRQLDVVLLDVSMPYLGGEALVRELRRLRADVRIVLCSGWREQEIARRFAGTGFAAFIQKPICPAALIAKLREVIDA